MCRRCFLYLIAATGYAILPSAALYAQDNPHRNADPPSIETRPTNQFGPYEFLIGEWDVKAADDGPPAAIIRARWGT
jgi:hypothetical protein